MRRLPCSERYRDTERDTLDGAVLGALERQQEIARLTTLINSLPQPVVAAGNDPAAGGGLALVCASDIRICSDNGVSAVSFITAGYSACDIGISSLLPCIVGAGHAHELMLTGRRFDAAYAEKIGLISRTTSAERLLANAYEIAAEIIRNPPISVEMSKRGMWLALETPTLRDDRVLDKRTPTYYRR